jgi:hypothetical protein
MTLDPTQGVPGSQFFTRTRFIQPPVAKGSLVAWYPFREGTGEDLTAGDSDFGDSTDYSATVNGATYNPSGGTTDIKTGANSGAFNFDGVDDSIVSSNEVPLSILGSSPRTLMYWVNPDNDTSKQFHATVGESNDAESFGGLQEGVNGNLRLFFYGFGVDFDTDKNLTANAYQHIAISYDSSVVRVFVNGVETPTSGVSRSLNTPRSDIELGRIQDGVSPNFFAGSLDGVRLYRNALSQSQINQVYLNTEP